MGLVDKLFGSYSAKELKRIRPQVKAVLEYNKAERHIRGGIATRRKYKGR